MSFGLAEFVSSTSNKSFWGRKAQLRSAVETMIGWRPERIVLAHGRWYDRDGTAELRRAFRWLRRPLVAVPVYALVLYGWHFAILFEAAVRYPFVHALQHMSFVAIGVLVIHSSWNLLRETVEQYEASTEELKASNEELQSSNEEMQSLNEELHTVNTEHQLKIKELQDEVLPAREREIAEICGTAIP